MLPESPLLLVDDEIDWLNSLALSLRVGAGLNHVEKCTDSRQVPELLRCKRYSLVLLDLNMPHRSGQELLQHIAAQHPELPVIVISGLNQIETAIRCIKSGAEDFFVKTDERARVVAGVTRVLKQHQLKRENRQLHESFFSEAETVHPAFSELCTVNPAMQKIFRYLEAVAVSREPVLITGESGVGKELIARALHRLSCPEKPWVAVNVAGLDDTVFSDTLFGHVKGAYTGADRYRPGMAEQAEDGILFLDEIGDLALPSQVKLLRLLQEGEFFPLGSDKPRQLKARIVVATNQDLPAREAAGTFRRDLLYRLWAHRVDLPPLRERKDDIEPLLQLFLAEAAESMGKTLPSYPAELVTLLATHSFPGNVRELRALVFDAVSRHQRGILSTASFREALPAASGASGGNGPPHDCPAAEQMVQFGGELPSLKQVGELLVEEALCRAQGNQSIAARMLGISHQALSKRLKNRD